MSFLRREHLPEDLWEVRRCLGNAWSEQRFSVCRRETGIAVCVAPRYADEEQTEIDFALIAAAPKLLRVLREVKELVVQGSEQALILEKINEVAAIPPMPIKETHYDPRTK